MQLLAYIEDGGRGALSDLARRVGLTPSHLQKIARGETWPSRETIKLIERETEGAVMAADIVWLKRPRYRTVRIRVPIDDEAEASA